MSGSSGRCRKNNSRLSNWVELRAYWSKCERVALHFNIPLSLLFLLFFFSCFFPFRPKHLLSTQFATMIKRGTLLQFALISLVVPWLCPLGRVEQSNQQPISDRREVQRRLLFSQNGRVLYFIHDQKWHFLHSSQSDKLMSIHSFLSEKLFPFFCISP